MLPITDLKHTLENMEGNALRERIGETAKACPNVKYFGIAVVYTPPEAGFGYGHQSRAEAILSHLPKGRLISSSSLLDGEASLENELAVVVDVHQSQCELVLQKLRAYDNVPPIIALERSAVDRIISKSSCDYAFFDIPECSGPWAVVDSWVNYCSDNNSKLWRGKNPIVVRCGSTEDAKQLTKEVALAFEAWNKFHFTHKELGYGVFACVDHVDKKTLINALAAAPLAIINGGVMLNEALALGTYALVIPQTAAEQVAASDYTPAEGVYTVTPELALDARVLVELAVSITSVSKSGIPKEDRSIDGLGALRIATMAVSMAAAQDWKLSRLPEGPL